jgi:hypothetical protein
MEERAMHMGIKRVDVDTKQEGGNLGYSANTERQLCWLLFGKDVLCVGLPTIFSISWT